jgi:hypothetical protein
MNGLAFKNILDEMNINKAREIQIVPPPHTNDNDNGNGNGNGGNNSRCSDNSGVSDI